MTRRTMTRQIVGYDPTTETVAVEHSIPVEQWDQITSSVGHNENDQGYISNYPLE